MNDRVDVFLQRWNLPHPQSIGFASEAEDALPVALHYRDYEFMKSELSALSDFLAETTSLRTLEIGHCSINSPGVETLSQGLSRNRGLESLHIHSDVIGMLGCKALSRAIEKHPALRALRLNANALNGGDIVPLLHSVTHHATLEHFDISRNSMDLPAADALKKMLAVNQEIRFLNVSACGIGSGKLRLISEGLAENTHIETLNLSHNRIGAEGMEILGKALAQHPRVMDLRIDGCGLGDEGMPHLADLLVANRRLQKVTLLANNVVDATPLLRIWTTQPTLIHFKWHSETDARPEDIEAMSEAVLASGVKNLLELSPANWEARVHCDKNTARAVNFITRLLRSTEPFSETEQADILERWSAVQSYLSPSLTQAAKAAEIMRTIASAEAPDFSGRLLAEGRPTSQLKLLCQLGLVALLAEPELWKGREVEGLRVWNVLSKILPEPVRHLMQQTDITALTQLVAPEPSFFQKRVAPALSKDRTR